MRALVRATSGVEISFARASRLVSLRALKIKLCEFVYAGKCAREFCSFFFACRCSNTHVFRVTVFCLALVRPPAGFCPFVHLNLDEFCDLKQNFLFNLARKRNDTILAVC